MTMQPVGRQRIMGLSGRLALLLLGAGWLAAFPGQASVKGNWADDASRDQSFSRILIVGISPDRNRRCAFERLMASMIRSAETVALVSCDAIPRETPLSRESVEAALAAENADAVLTTSLVSSSWEAQEGGTRDSRGEGLYKATDAYYGFYGTVVAVEFQTLDPITIVRGKGEVTTQLYEARGATLVYSMDTKVRDIESTDEGLLAISEPISKKLRKEGLIR